ncbi:hypothetical protein KIN20_033814 [Parelaphostrongylus tenuis]|uniref:Uncharacterized protein n=1 Tax=Parelaphostrongylus tenuis TaxID=148309 RepID=A0AAD5R997_PARTN|nr:hypothetical protein KIN20_033814 [Parelaphostrongylus tenuis]
MTVSEGAIDEEEKRRRRAKKKKNDRTTIIIATTTATTTTATITTTATKYRFSNYRMTTKTPSKSHPQIIAEQVMCVKGTK